MRFYIDKESLLSAAADCVDKLTDVAADIGFGLKNMIDICAEEARMKNIYAVLGKKYYASRGDIPDDEFRDLCDAAKKTEQKIAELKEDRILKKVYTDEDYL